MLVNEILINFSKNIDPPLSRGVQFLSKRINTVIISPHREDLETIPSCLYSDSFARCLCCREKARLSRRVTQGKLERKRSLIVLVPLLPLPFFSFLFSSRSFLGHRDNGSSRHARRRWQIRKERSFKLECDPWDGPPSTVINMQSKVLRSIPAWKTRRVGLYPVTVPSKKRVTRTTVSWKSIINGEFIVEYGKCRGYPIFDRCGLF